MSDHKSAKQLCEQCKKSYVNMRLHLKSDAHRKRIGQQAMPFAQVPSAR